MNNRLAIQDLAGLLAEYTGKDKNSSERFLREFIAVVSEGVYTDKLVKVKGLGTFKIIPVEKRESIHVSLSINRSLFLKRPNCGRMSILPIWMSCWTNRT